MYNSLARVLAIMTIASLLFGNFIIYSSAQSDSGRCNCVIFRLDDVQDFWLADQQLAIMNLFNSYNQKLTLGLVMDSIGNDVRVLEGIQQGTQKGLFELALHGWRHVDYSKLGEETQVDHFQRANSKMQQLSGNKFNIFLAPYNKFNEETISAMKKTSIKIISSDIYEDSGPYFVPGQGEGVEGEIYHMPDSVAYGVIENDNGVWKEVPNSVILTKIDEEISKNGYIVLTFHPQDLAFLNNATPSEDLNTDRLNDLTQLIETLMAKGIRTSSFSEVAQIQQQQYDIKEYISMKKEELLRKEVGNFAILVILPIISIAVVGVFAYLSTRQRLKRKK